MPTGPAFGWVNNSSPYIDAANLELMNQGPYRVNVDTPEAHGAKRDGSTNDTTAIIDAVNNVVSLGQSDGSNYGEVWFTAGIYQLTAATTKQASPTYGNAQVPLPLITAGSSVEKFTLVLRGVDCATALPHWNQTVAQQSGVVLRTTATGTNDATYGPASVIGGPTPEQGYGGGSGNTWSNMLVVVDGISIVSNTTNPTMSGFDFGGCLQAHIKSASYNCNADPSTMDGVSMTNQWTFGLRMPIVNNNDNCEIDDWSAQGVCYGCMISEHTNARRINAAYCLVGFATNGMTAATPHCARVDYASVESGVSGSAAVVGLSHTVKVDVGTLDMESVGGIYDASNYIQGTINVAQNEAPQTGAPGTRGSYIANGGSQIRLICRDVVNGAPGSTDAFPGNNTAYTNTYARDAAVTFGGGSITAVTVAGQSMPITGYGTVIVPENKTIEFTYTGTPSWVWTLL